MKRLSIISVFAIMIYPVSAQEFSSECKGNLSIFAENVKMKNYDGAYEPWSKVYDSCPSMNYATFAYADKILRNKIKKSTESKKKEYIDLLLEIYKKGNQYFPKKMFFADVQENTALLMHDYNLGDKEEIYAVLDKGFQKDKVHFDNPKAIYIYFSNLVDLHKEGKRDLQEVFDKYDAISEAIESNNESLIKKLEKIRSKESAKISSKEKRAMKIYTKKGEIFGKISSSIETKLGALADCKNLIPLYKKNFESHKKDVVWLKRAAARMDSKDCTDSPLFIKITEQLYHINPSAQAAYYLGLLKDKKGDSKGAIKYYNKAVGLETDRYKKAKILLRIGVKYKKRGDKQTAYRYAKRALANNPSYGDAYLIIAGIYADSANECGGTSFEKRSIYWKSAEMAKKAAKVQPSIKRIANETANSYLKRAPQKSDIFQSGMAGKIIKINCWVGGEIKVPNL